MIQSQEKVWAEGRTEGQTDRRMNRPYFIGPFRLFGGSPTSIYQITLRRLCSQILSFYFSSFISKDNHVLVEKHNPLEKSYDSQERTRWYWYRWHWKLRGFTTNSVHPWRIWESVLKFSLKVESLLEILTNRRSQTFYKLIDVHSATNVIGESISSIRMW